MSFDVSVQSTLAERRPMNSVGVKRKGEDVDHVFLRFGKRTEVEPETENSTKSEKMIR